MWPRKNLLVLRLRTFPWIHRFPSPIDPMRREKGAGPAFYICTIWPQILTLAHLLANQEELPMSPMVTESINVHWAPTVGQLRAATRPAFKERQKELFKACALQPEGPSSNSSFITSVHHLGLTLPALVSSSTNGYDYSICHMFMRIKWLVHEKHWNSEQPQWTLDLISKDCQLVLCRPPIPVDSFKLQKECLLPPSPHYLQRGAWSVPSGRSIVLSGLRRKPSTSIVSGFLSHMQYSVAYLEPQRLAYCCQNSAGPQVDKLGRVSISIPRSPKLSPHCSQEVPAGPALVLV